MTRALAVLSMLLLLLTGCMMDPDKLPPPHQTQKPTPQPSAEPQGFSILSVPLPGTEQGELMQAMGAYNSALYEFKGRIQGNSVSIWMDHYINGKPAESEARLDFMATKIEQGMIPVQMYFTTYVLENNKQMWMFSVRSKGERNSSTAGSRQMISTSVSGASAFGAQSTGDVKLGQPADLAMIVFSNQAGGGMEIGEVADTIRNNDEVYVLRCQFDS